MKKVVILILFLLVVVGSIVASCAQGAVTETMTVTTTTPGPATTQTITSTTTITITTTPPPTTTITTTTTPKALSYSGYIIAGLGELYRGQLLEQRMTIDQVEELVNDYLHNLNDPNLQAEEIIEFANDFYVRFSEKDTDINAFAALVNPYTGMMYAGHHADKYWNTKYKGESYRTSRGGGSEFIDWPSGPMTITQEEAQSYVQSVIHKYIVDGEVGSAQTFYGYYTIPLLQQGNVVGLVNINGYTGSACYEACHVSFIERKELR